MTNTYPLAGTVTRALKRDAGIITVQTYNRQGYRVRGGGDHPVSIFADFSDVVDSAEDVREAEALANTLAIHGWTVRTDKDRVVVTRVPGKAEAAGFLALVVARDHAEAALAALDPKHTQDWS